MENNTVVPQKIKNGIIIWSRNSGYISRRIESSISKRYLHTHGPRSIIHNSWKVEITQMSIHRWMDKQNVYTHNEILINLKGNSDTCHNIDEPWELYAKWNKPVTKGQTLHASTYVRHWRRKWQPTPVFLPGESQGRGSLVGCCLSGHTELDMTEVT